VSAAWLTICSFDPNGVSLDVGRRITRERAFPMQDAYERAHDGRGRRWTLPRGKAARALGRQRRGWRPALRISGLDPLAIAGNDERGEVAPIRRRGVR